MTELIAKLNDLFGSETTDQDQLVYVNNVIKGKLLESKVLQQQAVNNSKEQFANSPDFDSAQMDAIMSALDAHTSMSAKMYIASPFPLSGSRVRNSRVECSSTKDSVSPTQ
jgi:type I restriction enzyme, R subunit